MSFTYFTKKEEKCVWIRLLDKVSLQEPGIDGEAQPAFKFSVFMSIGRS